MKQFKTLMIVFGMMLVLAGCGGNKAPASGEGATSTDSQTQEEEQVQETGSESSAESEKEEASQDTESGEAGEDAALSKADSENDTASKGNILIAYFSRADENYGVGVVEKGNTEILAEMIAEETGGELFHIERDTPYPTEYSVCTDEAKKEQNDNARPALSADKDISDYDVIFLGYPIWWGNLPMPVYTFLEAHDWNGKTVIPFCTHAGSGLSNTEKSIADTCTGAEILKGLAVAGVTAQNEQGKAKEAVLDWLGGLQY